MRRWPSSTRCSNAAAAPPSPSKRTDGRPGSSVSIITTFSSGPSASGAVHLEQQVAVHRAGAQRPRTTAPPSAGRWRCRPAPRCSRRRRPLLRRAARGRRTGSSCRGRAAPRRAKRRAAAPARPRWGGSRARAHRRTRSWSPRTRAPALAREHERHGGLRDARAPWPRRCSSLSVRPRWHERNQLDSLDCGVPYVLC